MKYSFLYGITWSRLIRLLGANRFSIALRYWPRLLLHLILSLVNSWFAMREEQRYGVAILQTTVQKPPVFILGHWRSGTTHLHNLLALDSNFAAPSTFEVVYPHTFLSTHQRFQRILAPLVPSVRPADEVDFSWDTVNEEELALGALCGLSPYLAFTFPKRADFYSQFLDPEAVPVKEMGIYSETYQWFLKKLTFKHHLPLVLKSPSHTGRLAWLNKLYPGARYVHIIRNPITVFQSSLHLFKELAVNHAVQLQPIDEVDLQSRIIQNYGTMHAAYFRHESSLADGQLCIVRYEDLVRQPRTELTRIYAELEIPLTSEHTSRWDDYLRSITGYRQNVFPRLDVELRDTLSRKWAACFRAWNYSSEI